MPKTDHGQEPIKTVQYDILRLEGGGVQFFICHYVFKSARADAYVLIDVSIFNFSG